MPKRSPILRLYEPFVFDFFCHDFSASAESLSVKYLASMPLDVVSYFSGRSKMTF